MAYFPSLSVTQNVITDADNSNDNASQIAVGATWNSAGTGTSTLGVVGIQVSVKTDQNLEIYIDQSPDGTNWDITDTINYWHALGGDGWTIQAVNAYVRVRAKNVGTAETTYIRLWTVLCPIVEAVPRTLNEDGHFKTTVYGINGNLGTESHISPQGGPANDRNIPPRRVKFLRYDAGHEFLGHHGFDGQWSSDADGRTGHCFHGGHAQLDRQADLHPLRTLCRWMCQLLPHSGLYEYGGRHQRATHRYV